MFTAIADANRPVRVDSVSLGGTSVPFKFDSLSGELQAAIPDGATIGIASLRIASPLHRTAQDVVISRPSVRAEEVGAFSAALNDMDELLAPLRSKAAVASLEAGDPELFDDMLVEIDSLEAQITELRALSAAEREQFAIAPRLQGDPTLLSRLSVALQGLRPSASAVSRLPDHPGWPTDNTAHPQTPEGSPSRLPIPLSSRVYTPLACAGDADWAKVERFRAELSGMNDRIGLMLAASRPGVWNGALVRIFPAYVISSGLLWMLETDMRLNLANRRIPRSRDAGGSLTFLSGPRPTRSTAALHPYVLVTRLGTPLDVTSQQVGLGAFQGGWKAAVDAVSLNTRLQSDLAARLRELASGVAGLASMDQLRTVTRGVDRENARIARRRPTWRGTVAMRWQGPFAITSTSAEYSITGTSGFTFRLTAPLSADRTYLLQVGGGASASICDPAPAVDPPEPFQRVYATTDARRLLLSTSSLTQVLAPGTIRDVRIALGNPWDFPITVDLSTVGDIPPGVTAVLRTSTVELPARGDAEVLLRFVVQAGTRDALSPASLGIAVRADVGRNVTRCATVNYDIQEGATRFTRNDAVRVRIAGARKDETWRVEYGRLDLESSSVRLVQGVQALTEGDNIITIKLAYGNNRVFVRGVGGTGTHIRFEFLSDGITNAAGSPVFISPGGTLSPQVNSATVFRERSPAVDDNLRAAAAAYCSEINGA